MSYSSAHLNESIEIIKKINTESIERVVEILDCKKKSRAYFLSWRRG